MQHHFNVDVAVQYGINSAILLDNFYYWIEKNRANGNNFHDGQYWTYNSKRALSELFPYLTERQVRTAIDVLVDDGILVTGNYNKAKMDRTMWYSITKKGYEILGDCRTSLFDLPSMANATDLDGKAIPNNKHTNNKPDIIGPDEPDISVTKDSAILEEDKKEKEEMVGRNHAEKPRRNYTAKPQVVVDEEKKKLTRQQKQQIKIQELLEVVPKQSSPDLINALGEYLEMRIGLGVGKVDKEWFEKEWNDNIYPATQKYPIPEIVRFIKTVVIPRKYKRCFISINSSERRTNFNDGTPYTDDELRAAKERGERAVEQAKRDGTYRHEF